MSEDIDFENTMQLFVVGVKENTHTIRVQKSCTVDDLVTETKKQIQYVSNSVFYMTFGAKPLREGTSLADYNIQNGSTICVMLRLRGGINPLKLASSRKYTLTELPGYITLTTDPCMISLNDDPATKRAKMPCGHAIEPGSMSQYARSLLEKNSYTFPCPYTDTSAKSSCGKSWDWFMVRHVAALLPHELQSFEKRLAENYAEMAMGVRKCPGCSSLCLRRNKGDQIVRCPVCTTEHKRPYDFCWCCLKISDSNTCRNLDCDGKDPRIKVLATCPMTKMQFTGIEVPSIRACPHCGILITHVAGCKHMQCTGCSGAFCFVCLGKADKSGTHPCGSYNTKCTPTDRQTNFD